MERALGHYISRHKECLEVSKWLFRDLWTWLANTFFQPNFMLPNWQRCLHRPWIICEISHLVCTMEQVPAQGSFSSGHLLQCGGVACNLTWLHSGIQTVPGPPDAVEPWVRGWMSRELLVHLKRAPLWVSGVSTVRCGRRGLGEAGD